MSQIVLEIPTATLLAFRITPEEAGTTLRLAAAMKFFELEQLSSGAAAWLAGVPRTVFLTRLADYGVDTLQLSAEDLDQETRLA